VIVDENISFHIDECASSLHEHIPHFDKIIGVSYSQEFPVYHINSRIHYDLFIGVMLMNNLIINLPPHHFRYLQQVSISGKC
jgi:hypothetical protein